MRWNGGMKKTAIRTAFTLGITVIFTLLLTLSANTQLISPYTQSSPIFLNIQDPIDMIIFVSPQYANDKDIRNVIDLYIAAVKDDLGWGTKVITITTQTNDYQTIDKIIEQYYMLYRIKTCIMVGEDTDTALGGDYDYMNKPSTIPWSTIGGEDAYEMSEQGIICQPYKMDICISLIYPTNELDYGTKKSQIIDAFDKFSNQRHVYHSKKILVFESSDINTYSKEIYKNLADYGNLHYHEDPSSLEISKSLTESYLMYFVHGHSNPAMTKVNPHEDGLFSADNVDEIDAPLFGADGCYVNGWWSDQLNTNTLEPSIGRTWYGSKIFTSKNVKVMVLGLLSQSGFSYPVSFIENTLPDLIEGKTLAESMIGDTYLDATVIIGDPTFQYNFVN